MMTKKSWELDMGERTANSEDPDVLLDDKVSDRRRKRIDRQEELDKAEHSATMAELKKKETSAEVAVEKSSEKKEGMSGFTVKGGVDLGTFNFPALLQKQADEREALRLQAEDTAGKTQQENHDLRERLHDKDMEIMKTGHDAQMQVLTRMIESNASRGGFMEQYNAAIETAKTLGFNQPQMAGDLTSKMELKKMEFDHTMELRRMARDEKRSDRDFQRQLNKDADEREAGKTELARQERRDDMVAKAPQVLGGAIAQGLLANQGKGGRIAQEPTEEAPPSETGTQEGYHVEVGWGESNEMECPGCKQPVAIGPTARTAVCASCGERVPIKRTGEKQ